MSFSDALFATLSGPRRHLRAVMPVSPRLSGAEKHGSPGITRAFPLPRTLFLAAALAALAVLFAGDSVQFAQAQQTTSVYFPYSTRLAQEVDRHGLRYTRMYSVAIDPPLQSASTVHLKIKSNSTATQGEDYRTAMPNAPGTTTTKVLQLPAGASQASFAMWVSPDGKTEGLETVDFELEAIEDAPYEVVDDYQSTKFVDMEVSILDNSRPAPPDADPERGIEIEPWSVTVGPKTKASYTVVLTSMPDSDVTVKAYIENAEGPVNIGFAGSVLSVSPASLTFDSSNWSTAQTFTLSTHDAALGLDELISHSVESDDLDYSTNYWFQGGDIDDDRLIGVSVAAGGL